MSKTQRCTLGLVATTLALGALVVGWMVASGQITDAHSEEPSAEPIPDGVVPAPPRHKPFTMYPADEGAWTYEEHRVGPPTDENDVRPSRESVDDALEFAENIGYDVHQQWSAYSRMQAERARVKAAESAAGTSGLGDVGVP